ncbi:uncharacterized protein M421DRAFT_421278 [Didymella exigua CBS 183.55]|uniref:Uncharacterized protein n=1 Tax=Didymella exigua CBS 183.55 TaxID=1150837 RepID=A0A6A5RRI0_9PLEO|nr:uncharacterized protein M421DRAFT_421278 [Didymella exigua CBS 183.55]KAF1928097.1 hypothetical protein M421DRAFT_421278 [Didymella exigua CBS 183.55]
MPASLDVEGTQLVPGPQGMSGMQRSVSAGSRESPNEIIMDQASDLPAINAAHTWEQFPVEPVVTDRHGPVPHGSYEDIRNMGRLHPPTQHLSGRRLPSIHSLQALDGSYACLTPLLPYLSGVLKPQLALQLLELYFAPPEGTLFHNASPYVLTPVLRRKSILDAANARPTTPALLATMIWVTAQTASLPELLAPGARSSLSSKLQDLVFKLQHDRDPDSWQRVSGGHVQKPWHGQQALGPTSRDPGRPTPVIDDVLSLILITIVTSGGDFKRDCLPWWSKALALIETMKLHQLDHPDARSNDEEDDIPLTEHLSWHPRLNEAKEEMRRTYWLAFALDRHLALSFNSNLAIMDGESCVYTPLPERAWQSCDEEVLGNFLNRQQGPSALVTGTGFFEFFLPLMVLLGDIVHLRRRRHHPRLGILEGEASIALVENLLDRCKESIDGLQQGRGHRSSITELGNPTLDQGMGPVLQAATPGSFILSSTPDGTEDNGRQNSRVCLVTAYAHFILHVLYILLHGEWDALTMLAWLPYASSQDEWITSPSFHKCSSHAVYASEAISSILDIDSELIFMPYLFGIYLFHGSLVLLLFADRMPAVHGGPNSAVEAACETIIRAHEACIVTLNTEFQRVFRRVMRATLMVVKTQNKTGWPCEVGKETESGGLDGNAEVVRERIVDMRKDMLRLYRWNQGGRGLAV